MMRPKTGVSVVIPVRNGAACIEDTLDAVFELSHDQPIEVIVVNDGSTDGSDECLRRIAATRPLQIVAGAGRGAAAAVNTGIRAASYPLIAQIDQDVVVEREWLRQGLIQFFLEQRNSAAHVPRYRVEVPEETLAVELDEGDETKAKLECVARFFELGPPETPAWEVAIQAEAERGPQGWAIVRTDHRTLSGQRIGGR